jgi:hypothetical protein
MHATGEGLFEEIKRLRRERDEARTALRNLLDGFDHVRHCRECGDSDASECEPGGVSALTARANAEAALALPPEGQ